MIPLGQELEKVVGGSHEAVKNSIGSFFFRYDQHGKSVSFTHSTFSDYLATRNMRQQFEYFISINMTGSEDLENWVHVCGPQPISNNMQKFLVSEVASANAQNLQSKLTELFSEVMEKGAPVPDGQPPRERLRQVRNAEEALLVALNACARSTGKVSEVKWHGVTRFGEWFRWVLGQRTDRDATIIAAVCLSFLDLSNLILHNIELSGCNLRQSKLRNVHAYFANFMRADLTGADFSDSVLYSSNFQGAMLTGAIFERANLGDCDFTAAQGLEKATFVNVSHDWATGYESTC
jgi:uncharacterized protein YjbI with pentapeptide repeats